MRTPGTIAAKATSAAAIVARSLPPHAKRAAPGKARGSAGGNSREGEEKSLASHLAEPCVSAPILDRSFLQGAVRTGYGVAALGVGGLVVDARFPPHAHIPRRAIPHLALSSSVLAVFGSSVSQNPMPGKIASPPNP